ncbi:MAG: DUF4391 domain-containing protein [Muribaculaceae bacterium]
MAQFDEVNAIISTTLPAVAEGTEVKGIFVVDVELKRFNFDNKAISLIAKAIPQRIIFALRYADKVRFAAFHTKFFLSDWQQVSYASLPLSGLNFDMVWSNLISSIGNLVVEQENSLTEQIKIDEEKQKLQQQIANLERQMNATKQPRRKRELYNEIKRLKGGEV